MSWLGRLSQQVLKPTSNRICNNQPKCRKGWRNSNNDEAAIFPLGYNTMQQSNIRGKKGDGDIYITWERGEEDSDDDDK